MQVHRCSMPVAGDAVRGRPSPEQGRERIHAKDQAMFMANTPLLYMHRNHASRP